jgi:hypothetical protein
MTGAESQHAAGQAIDTDRLAACIAHKLRLLERLVELSRQQDQSIAADDVDALLRLLAVKQRLVEGLQQVERALDPYRAQAPESRVWRSPAEREKCRAASQRCDGLLQELLASEERAGDRLAQERDRAEARLQGFDSISKAQSAYMQNSPQPAPRLDLSSL